MVTEDGKWKELVGDLVGLCAVVLAALKLFENIVCCLRCKVETCLFCIRTQRVQHSKHSSPWLCKIGLFNYFYWFFIFIVYKMYVYIVYNLYIMLSTSFASFSFNFVFLISLLTVLFVHCSVFMCIVWWWSPPVWQCRE
jgi:hypothetical protein